MSLAGGVGGGGGGGGDLFLVMVSLSALCKADLTLSWVQTLSQWLEGTSFNSKQLSSKNLNGGDLESWTSDSWVVLCLWCFVLLRDGNGELAELHLYEYTFPADCKKTPIHQQYYSTTAKNKNTQFFYTKKIKDLCFVATEKYVFNRNDNQKPKFCTKTVHQYERNYQDCFLAIKKIGDKTIYTFKLRGTSQVFVNCNSRSKSLLLTFENPPSKSFVIKISELLLLLGINIYYIEKDRYVKKKKNTLLNY